MSQVAFVAGLVDALVAAGVRQAVLSPGYRSAPLALALDAHPEVTVTVIVDERVAAFYALGLARGVGGPVALACTSGSAVANYLPAVVEAHRARIPLVLLTADRPPELQRIGAPQTMIQGGLFHSCVVWEDCLGDTPALDSDLPRAPWGLRVAQAIAAATADDGGPVHLNLPLRKPLLPPGCEGGANAANAARVAQVEHGARIAQCAQVGQGAKHSQVAQEASEGGSAASAQYAQSAQNAHSAPPPRILRGHRRLDAAALGALAARFAGAERPVIVAGPMIREHRGATAAAGAAIADLAARSGWPLIGDLLAPCRPQATQVADAIARRRGGPVADAILWFGDPPVSAALLRWIGRCTGPVVQVIPGGRWADPSLRVDLAVDCEPAALAAELTLPAAPADWRQGWAEAEAAAQAHLREAAPAAEGAALAALVAAWPGSVIHVANSTAVRELDTFGGLRPGQRVLGNRGLNGIDGTLATAAGEAQALGEPLLAIVGDLAFAHDLGALVHLPPRTAGAGLVVVVVANGGGQIFRQLPLRELAVCDPLFVTPRPLDLEAIAAATGWAYAALTTGALRREPAVAVRLIREGIAGGGRRIVELRSEPEAAAAAREALWRAW